MRASSYFGDPLRAQEFAAAVGALDGVASLEWVEAPGYERRMGHDGDWRVVWEVLDERLGDLLGVDQAERQLAAAARRGPGEEVIV